ncbi:MAG: histidinol dehydrogenase [Aquisalinus sp.]|nr:histidinol dehydrogenase [Aquisalinus sp.]
MQVIEWSGLSSEERKLALARPESRQAKSVTNLIQNVFAAVSAEGDKAVARFAEEFDKLAPGKLDLTEDVVAEARASVDDEDYQALVAAATNIRAFHEAEVSGGYETQIAPGIDCARVMRPLGTAGLYVPGGTAPLFSTLLMLAIPARIAGVQNVIVCTPPDRHGGINPFILLAASICQVDAIYLVGGAQAIAALSIGTDMIPKADIIAGPGNAYVTAAKAYAAALPNGPIIDMPAGPSELLVVADETADPDVIAADLLSQAEHDADAQVVFVTTDSGLVQSVQLAVEEQLAVLPRQKIARQSLAHGKAILVQSMKEAIEVINAYAPEHLSLNVKAAEQLMPKIRTAGTVFVGSWAAETFGDYAAGPSHVLPTDGAAQKWSGVSVSTFQRSMTVQRVAQAGVSSIAAISARLARLEGLEAHARAADIRLAKAEAVL